MAKTGFGQFRTNRYPELGVDSLGQIGAQKLVLDRFG